MIVALKTLACLSFRPLAGINCNMKMLRYAYDTAMFPSPRGDKLQLQTLKQQ